MAFSGDESLFLFSQMVLALAICIIEVYCVAISYYHVCYLHFISVFIILMHFCVTYTVYHTTNIVVQFKKLLYFHLKFIHCLLSTISTKLHIITSRNALNVADSIVLINL